jgi:hypothetical protein
MGIVGDKPESGVRIVLERPRDGGPPWVYAGSAFTPDEAISLGVTVDGDGAVHVTLSEEAPNAELAEKVRLMVRTVYKQAQADGERAPARKIVRWRGEK